MHRKHIEFIVMISADGEATPVCYNEYSDTEEGQK